MSGLLVRMRLEAAGSSHKMSSTFPQWVLEAAALPVAFAQVREDPLLDRWVVDRLGDGARVALIASGGCTAALLAAAPKVIRLDLVDPNPAQLALARLKLQLLRTCAPADRLALLGHAPLAPARRRAQLAALSANLELPIDALGPVDFVAEVGLDQAGRYEAVFAALRQVLDPQRGELEALLRLKDPAEQRRRVEPGIELGRRIDQAFDTILALPNLVRLFGVEATKNPVEPFSRHFARRLRHVLATLPADQNPYLWQMLLGRYPEGGAVPWLQEPTPSGPGPQVAWLQAPMAEALEANPGAYDYVHLSNCLDWLTPEQAQATLEVAWRALRPGGWTLIRQLNSVLDIPSLGPSFAWQHAEAQGLHQRDRSFFYRALHLGKKR
jgi:S-adenosylmethionine-diacylglycerol 3-amino-3-carboxypropyl transferase